MQTLKILVLAATFFLWPFSTVETSSLFPSFFQHTGDGKLSIYDPRTKAVLEVMYRDANGKYQDDALKQIDQFLACRETHEVIPISLKLIELVDHIEDHFGASQVQVVSAYRSAEYNTKLRKRIRRVARHSMHLNGRAMDLKIPGVSSRAVRAYALSLKAGGVGYYGANRYIHIDTGPVRTW